MIKYISFPGTIQPRDVNKDNININDYIRDATWDAINYPCYSRNATLAYLW